MLLLFLPRVNYLNRILTVNGNDYPKYVNLPYTFLILIIASTKKDGRGFTAEGK